MSEGVCCHLGKVGWWEGNDGPTYRIVCGALANAHKRVKLSAASYITSKRETEEADTNR